MKISIYNFDASEAKKIIFKKIDEDDKFKDFPAFKETVKNVIDNKLISEMCSTLIVYILENYELTNGKNNNLININLPSFYLGYQNLFTGKKLYNNKILYKTLKSGKCEIYIEYEKAFKEKDYFEFKLINAIEEFKKILNDVKVYTEIMNSIVLKFEEKINVSFEFIKSLAENSEENEDKEEKDLKIAEHVFLIIAEQNANRQYCKYLQRKANKEKNAILESEEPKDDYRKE